MRDMNNELSDEAKKNEETRQEHWDGLFKGRTIAFVDARCINDVIFYFTDGTVVEIEGANGPLNIPHLVATKG